MGFVLSIAVEEYEMLFSCSVAVLALHTECCSGVIGNSKHILLLATFVL